MYNILHGQFTSTIMVVRKHIWFRQKPNAG